MRGVCTLYHFLLITRFDIRTVFEIYPHQYHPSMVSVLVSKNASIGIINNCGNLRRHGRKPSMKKSHSNSITRYAKIG